MGVWEAYGIVRRTDRPRFDGLVLEVFDEWEDLGSPDPAVMIGKAKLQIRRRRRIGRRLAKVSPLEIMVIGQVNRKDCNYGMMRPDGYRAAYAAMGEAERLGMPLVTFIDTPGADPYEEANRNLQAWAISDCIAAMCRLRVPTLAVILGEGGSGGALALGVADRVLMAENAVYSVIAPEGCAAILLRGRATDADVEQAAEEMRADAGSMHSKGIVDRIIDEPRHGAHADPPVFYRNVRTEIRNAFRQRDISRQLRRGSIDDLLKQRYERYTKNNRVKEARSYKGRIMSIAEVPDEAWEEALSSMDVVAYTGLEFGTSHKITKLGELLPKEGEQRNLFQQALQDLLGLAPERWSDEDLILKCSGGKGKPEMYKLPDFIPPNYACPNQSCNAQLGEIGRAYRRSAKYWLDVLVDGGFHAFNELHKGLISRETGFSLGGKRYRDDYNSALAELGLTESLRIGTAEVSGIEAVLAISDFSFIGGSMGVAFGKKFVEAADYAIEKGLPLISVTASGGARMQEGILSLTQMASTVMATNRLKAEGIPRVSVLDVATGGTVASYAVQADLILGVEGGTIAFAGPAVVEALTNKTLSRESLRPEFYYPGGVHRVVKPGEVKGAVAEYLSSRIPAAQPLA